MTTDNLLRKQVYKKIIGYKETEKPKVLQFINKLKEIKKLHK